MTPLITRDRISLQTEADDWTEAVRASADLLLRDRYITPTYVEAIFASFDANGDYMIVAPEIVLAHARPESGALETGISVLSLSRPVLFRNDAERPIRVVFTLAANDPDRHLKLMQVLAGVLVDSASLQILKTSTDVDEVLRLLVPTER